jgi:DNA-binding response OmpR family regulator
MGENGPSILVVDDSWDERRSIAELLREAGFDVAAMGPDGGALAALDERQFAAAVVALPDGEGAAFLRRARRRQRGLKGLIITARAAMPLLDDDCAADCATLINRPFDPRQLLGCVFALVLREEEQTAATGHGQVAAEFGIAAAKLVCLQNRRIAAAAAGASRLAHELSRQISETAALHAFAAAP